VDPTFKSGVLIEVYSVADALALSFLGIKPIMVDLHTITLARSPQSDFGVSHKQITMFPKGRNEVLSSHPPLQSWGQKESFQPYHICFVNYSSVRAKSVPVQLTPSASVASLIGELVN
jgi:hypothetical protein